jgi:hypothetical protein
LRILVVGTDKLDINYGGGQVYVQNLVAAFNSYDPETVWPGSFWMRKIK